jgi:hypothetical protein
MPKYTRQIVVFLDILGFSSLLNDFEREALDNDNIGEEYYHESQGLNKLIAVFEDVIKYIKDKNFKYYLFSDNLCITIEFVDSESENPEIFVDILSLLTLMVNEFMKEGYFIRGAIDAGWFLNYNDMAIGRPLVCAYHLETKKAIYPRIVLSNNYIEFLNQYKTLNKFPDYQIFLLDNYIKEDSDLSFLNPLLYVVNYEDKYSKIEYFQNSSQIISANLDKYKSVDNVYLKYEWLAHQFNDFLEYYINDDAYRIIDNDQLVFSENELDLIKNSKIIFHGI